MSAGESGCWNIPKLDVVGTLQILLQTRRLQIPRALADGTLLVKELENFKLKVATARQETLETWRTGPHDDLVFAAGLAAWLGEQTLPAPPDHPREPPAGRLVAV